LNLAEGKKGATPPYYSKRKGTLRCTREKKHLIYWREKVTFLRRAERGRYARVKRPGLLLWREGGKEALRFLLDGEEKENLSSNFS